MRVSVSWMFRGVAESLGDGSLPHSHYTRRSGKPHSFRTLTDRRSLDMIDAAFPSVALQDQDFLGSCNAREKFIASLPDEGLRKMVRDLWGTRNLRGGDFGAEEYWLLFEKLIERLAVHSCRSRWLIITFCRRTIQTYLGSLWSRNSRTCTLAWMPTCPCS